MQDPLAALQASAGVPLQVRQRLAGARELYTPAQISFAVDQLAVRMAVALQEALPVFITVLGDGVRLSGILMDRLVMPAEFGYVHRAPDSAGGNAMVPAGVHPPLQERTVVFLSAGAVDAELVDWAQAQGAQKVIAATLVAEEHSVQQAQFTALTVPAGELLGVGFGLAGYGRNLPSLYLLKE